MTSFLKARRDRAPTERQGEVYRWIFAYTREKGFQPSFREIMDEFGMTSTNGVKANLVGLKKKGYVDIYRYESRAIRFLKTPDGKPFLGFREVGP